METVEDNTQVTDSIHPSQVANFFLEQAHIEEIPTTQLKLLKLVYIGYGWVGATLDRKLFNEPIEAWKHGPVVPSLYHEFKHFGSSPIEGFSVFFDLEELDFNHPKISPSEKDINHILFVVWDIYKRYSAWDLRGKTHEDNTPWSNVYSPGTIQIIGFDSIKSHFIKKITEYLQKNE